MLLTPPHHWNAQMRPEGDDDMQEHESGWWHKAGALGVTIHDYV